MKQKKLLQSAIVAVLALAALGQTATAASFTYTGSLKTWTVQTSGLYDITAYGAQGGDGGGFSNSVGGLGAKIGGDISLTAGETLNILVGGVWAAKVASTASAAAAAVAALSLPVQPPT